MARRVSLKGKGADLFFGDYPPGVDDPGTPSEEPVAEILLDTVIPAEIILPEAGSVTEAAETSASPPERSYSSAVTTEPTIEFTAELLGAEFIDAIWERLSSQASISNSFRYTENELDELKDVLYHVSKDERVRLTKQDIARLGLNVVLWDYRRRGDASLLSEFARRKRRPQES